MSQSWLVTIDLIGISETIYDGAVIRCSAEKASNGVECK